MFRGEVLVAAGESLLNDDAETIALAVANTGGRSVWIGSQHPFADANAARDIDRAARGPSLDSAPMPISAARICGSAGQDPRAL